MMRILCGVLAVALATTTLRADEPPSKLDRLWTDLSGKDEGKATRAALVLAGTPAETVAFLSKSLQPVKIEEAKFNALVKQLDSDDFDKRDAAYVELEYHGKTIRARLQKVLDAKPSPEVRNQVGRLIEASYCDDSVPAPKAAPAGVGGGGSISITSIGGKRIIKIDGVELDTTPRVIEKPGPQPSWVRAARATAVLEYIGTPEARALLKKMAEGEVEALPTKSAREALERLK